MSRGAPPSADLVEGATGPWEVVIGLEVHAQVVSRSKLFSGAATDFGADPNTQVSLVDAAMPGMLPVLNWFCVEQAVRTGLGLKARINRESVFARKNYFYPDLPQGYQISQYESPIVSGGEVILDMRSGPVRVGIERLHLEQDAGKSLHDQDPSRSFVDLNRSGVALMEIVSHPDMRSAAQAQAYVRKLRTILRYLGTCDGNMEQGSLRADVNVSVRRPGEALGTRCEVKNVNSIRFMGQAIEYESARQVALLEEGGRVDQETRLFDPRAGETRSMRSKEEAHDYRYFPDPDLPMLVVESALVESIAADLPELPDDKKDRLMRDYGLNAYDAGVLVGDPANADYFEAVAKGRDSKRAANWVTGDLFGALNKDGLSIERSPVSAAALGVLLDLIEREVVSGRIAKEVFEIMFKTGADANQIVRDRGLEQMSDRGDLEAVIDEILAANPEKVAQVKKKPKLAGWFVGEVMKATGGKANPKSVNEILTVKLGL